MNLSFLLEKGALRRIAAESVATVATVAVATSDKVNVIGDKTTIFTARPVATPATPATPRFRRLEVQEEQLVRAILKHIGENSPTCVEEVLGQCRTNPDALKFWLERSKDLPGQTQLSDVSCGDCCQFKRSTHPHLGHCLANEHEALAGLWDSDRRKCASFTNLKG